MDLGYTQEGFLSRGTPEVRARSTIPAHVIRLRTELIYYSSLQGQGPGRARWRNHQARIQSDQGVHVSHPPRLCDSLGYTLLAS